MTTKEFSGVRKLSEIRVEHVLNMAGSSTQDFNCWGATMFVVHAKDRLGWVDNEEISEWLTNSFEPIEKEESQKGDILALFDVDEKKERIRLVHTAVKIGDNKFVHKIGQREAEVDSLKGVIKHYINSSNGCAFLRFKGDENDN